MALFVLCDPKYRHGVWCDTKLRGIMDEAARRRIQPEVFVSTSAAKAAVENCEDDTSIILLFDSVLWLTDTVKALSHCNAHIILSANYVDVSLPVTYSLVGTDVDGAMRDMIDYLHSCGKRRIAMVGVNPFSCNDRGRADMFCKYSSADECHVFYIEEDLMECFDEFIKAQDSFDAAICTNDLLAISLVEYLKEHHRAGEKLFVLSHTDTIMSRLYGDGITSMTTNFYNCGKMLVEAHFNRIKYGLASTTSLLPATLKIRGSTDDIPYCPSNKLAAVYEQEVLSSPKNLNIPTSNIGKLERMLAVSDLINLKLMYCLMCGYNYEKMSEFCFVSAETARYRVRKIRNALGVQNKTQAAELFRLYVKKESLISFIGELEEKNNRIFV